MGALRLTPAERRQMKQWMENEDWAERRLYAGDMEYLACVQDILEHPVFCSMDHYYQHGTTTCKEHCIRVSYLSYRICRKVGWDSRSAARASLLHDLFLYDWHTHAKLTGQRFHGFTHPRTALKNAVRYFELTEQEQDMILRHMWPLTPVPPSTREGLAVCYADKVCSLAEVVENIRDRIRSKTGVRHDILGKTI